VVDATDFIFLDTAGNIADTVSLDLTPVLAKEITLDSSTGPIAVTLRMRRGNNNDGNRLTKVDLGYHNGGSVTTIGSVSTRANLNNTIQTYNFSVSLASTTVIPAGNQIRLTVTNLQNRPAELYSFDSAGNRSTVDIVPDSVINVDSMTFWTGTMGAGTQVTNPDPNGVDVDIYAKIVVSDPFGEADIQAPDAATNPTTVLITDPDGNAVLDASTSCTAPCYAYDGEDTTNDPANDATRTFYYIVRIDSDPPATRGTWTVTVTANEGLETGLVSHVAANTFTTLTQSNLSTSTKSAINVVGDVDPSDTLTYEITLINTGGQDADNVVFSDTLQSSPVALTFSSASTTCTDEVPAALPNPSHAGGVVSLSNISLTSGGSCKITIVVTVGAGTPGDLIDNSATITNPVGSGATPSATTLLLSESQIPVAGSKQLYLEGIGGGSTLTRTQPTSGSSIILNPTNTTESLTFSATTRAMTLSSGPIDINLNLGSDNTRNGRNRNMTVELFVDANDGNGPVSIDSQTKNVRLQNPETLHTFNLTNAADLTLLVGTTFQLAVTNNEGNNNKRADLVQVTSAPFSEAVIPVTGSIEVTELKFYDRSGTDETGNPGCSPVCGSEVTPPTYLESGSTIWTRGTIADAFGSFDVNTGCDGVTVINCPTITITDPLFADKTPVSPANELTYLQAPDTSSRQYEFEVDPFGLGLDGVWQIEVLGTEGVEGAMMDSAVATFERFSPPVLTIVKTAIGTTLPGQIVTYNNNVTNTGASIAKTIILTNTIGSFLQLELVESGGSWTAVSSLSAAFSINIEEFDSGGDTFTYDPVTGCGAAIPANSPCYDPVIVKWRIELNETLPVSGNIIEEYRAMIE